MKRVTLLLIVLLLCVGSPGSSLAQSPSCDAKDVVASFAQAVASETQQAWQTQYDTSDCSPDVISAADALYNAYASIEATTTEPPDCSSPDITPAVCDVFAQASSNTEFTSFENQPGSFTYDVGSDCKRSGKYGLKLDYDFAKQSGSGGWIIDWSNSSDGVFDGSAFKTLNFYAKGEEGNETFEIGLLDSSTTPGEEPKIVSKGKYPVSTEWTQITIPLTKFKGVKLNSLKNLNFGFNKAEGTGSICVDDIAFE